MTWLIGLLESAGLNWLWDKISGLFKDYLAKREAEKEIDDLVKQDIDKLKAATDAKSKEDAATDLANHF